MPTRIKEMSGLEYYVPVVRNNNLEWINIFAHPDIKAGVEKALKECKDFDWLLNEVKGLVKWKMWSRYEYEVSIGEPFGDRRWKIDSYEFFKHNAERWLRGVIAERNMK